MTLRLINIGLILAFLSGYMEWGQGNSAFVFDAARAIFTEADNLIGSLTHPLIISGLAGLIILIYCAIRPDASRRLNTIGILILSPVVLLILLSGGLSGNLKSVASTLPFLGLAAAYYIVRYKRRT
jgi:hypothetical protein